MVTPKSAPDPPSLQGPRPFRNTLLPVSSPPDYAGGGLADLICELERRLTGEAIGPGLRPDLGSAIGDAASYVLLLVDGLGVAQLRAPAAKGLAAALAGTLHAPFPTTTSVSLATVATGTTPSRHGLVSHLMWHGDPARVVNTLKWVDLTGARVEAAYEDVLPPDNLWERLRRSGIEPITLQPAQFRDSPLTRLTYRGARFEPVWDPMELVDAAVQLAATPGRLVFAYLWQVDFAGHVHGLDSPEFEAALRLAANVWDGLAARLPEDTQLVGTADHGLIQYGEDDKIVPRDPGFEGLSFAGDPRGVLIRGSVELVEGYAAAAAGTLVDPLPLAGPDPSPTARERLQGRLLIPPEGKVVLPPGFDRRLRAYHGGLAPDEVEIPLLAR